MLRARYFALLLALPGGAALALGYVMTHFLPTHPVLSDSFPSGDVSVVSWVAASLEVVAAPSQVSMRWWSAL